MGQDPFPFLCTLLFLTILITTTALQLPNWIGLGGGMLAVLIVLFLYVERK